MRSLFLVLVLTFIFVGQALAVDDGCGTLTDCYTPEYYRGLKNHEEAWEDYQRDKAKLELQELHRQQEQRDRTIEAEVYRYPWTYFPNNPR